MPINIITPEEIAAIIVDLSKNNMTRQALCAKYGRSESGIRTALRRARVILARDGKRLITVGARNDFHYEVVPMRTAQL